MTRQQENHIFNDFILLIKDKLTTKFGKNYDSSDSVVDAKYGDDFIRFIAEAAEKIDENASVYCGMTKCVIVFPEVSRVLKIPFSGLYFKDDCSNFHFHNFINATKDIPHPDSEWDYCETESYLYEKAKEDGFSEFLAEEELYEWCNDMPIYTQAKAKVAFVTNGYVGLSEDEIINIKEKIRDSETLTMSPFYGDWLVKAVSKYGVPRIEDFVINFIRKYNIKDLHLGNIGYDINGNPVLIDWSSWNDGSRTMSISEYYYSGSYKRDRKEYGT